MFIIPFFFAGFFMLTMLNPHYTATLISQAIPQVRLLGAAFPPIAGFLARPPIGLNGSQQLSSGFSLVHPRFYNLSEFIQEGPEHGLYAIPSGPKRWTIGFASFKTLSDRETIASDLPNLSPMVPSGALEVFVLLLVVLLVWYVCTYLTSSNVRVPRPLSAAASVEDFLPQPAPRAYAPPSPSDLGTIPEASSASDNSSSIPTQLEFVTPPTTDLTDGAPFVVYTRAAIDAIMTLPARIRTFSAAMAGSIDELDSKPSPTGVPCPDGVSANCDLASETTQGIQRLLADSGRLPPIIKRQGSADVEETSHAKTEPEVTVPPHASVTDIGCDVTASPASSGEDLNSGATSQACDQPRRPPTPSLADAVMYTVKRMPPKANSSSSAHLNAPRMHMRGRARSGIEEIVDRVQQSPATTADSAATDPRGPEVPQSRPGKPHVTIWPGKSSETRRLRMPSTHPMGMAASASTWDQSRRMCTVSGI